MSNLCEKPFNFSTIQPFNLIFAIVQNYSSKLIEQAVDQMATLPGVGRRTALRLVLNLLKRSPEEVKQFSDAFTKLRNEVQFCKTCNNISDAPKCSICTNPSRDRSTICVVEDIRDVMAIENTQQYKGLYHVLGGIISPMDGIGPEDLTIDKLVERVETDEVNEIILALSATMEGDTTNFYIYRKMAPSEVEVTTLSRGVAVGDELEYADEVTLGRSLVHRTPFTLDKR